MYTIIIMLRRETTQYFFIKLIVFYFTPNKIRIRVERNHTKSEPKIDALYKSVYYTCFLKVSSTRKVPESITLYVADFLILHSKSNTLSSFFFSTFELQNIVH